MKSDWELIGKIPGWDLDYEFGDDDTFEVFSEPDDNPDSVSLLLTGAIREGTVVIDGVHLETTSPRGLTADSQRVPVGAIRAEIGRRIRDDGDEADHRAHVLEAVDWKRYAPEVRERFAADVEQAARSVEKANQNLRSFGRIGRPALTDKDLALTAITAIEVGEAGKRAPVKEIAKLLWLSRSAASWRISEARKQHWLKRTTPGIFEALPTSKLLAWLEENDEPTTDD